MGLLSSLALTPLPWPWDAHAPRQALALEALALNLSLSLEAAPAIMRMPEGNTHLSCTHSKAQPTQQPWVLCSLGQTLPKLLLSSYTD